MPLDDIGICVHICCLLYYMTQDPYFESMTNTHGVSAKNGPCSEMGRKRFCRRMVSAPKLADRVRAQNFFKGGNRFCKRLYQAPGRARQAFAQFRHRLGDLTTSRYFPFSTKRVAFEIYSSETCLYDIEARNSVQSPPLGPFFDISIQTCNTFILSYQGCGE